ncbi:TetR/AcrR family transcriptional regulator [Nocardioides jishulii]|uniref:TetR family transcriptional regulator n=1 Tax=Nocardioides jishulii TaxID=2575440 RepID=A0A4U2YQG4_9ACTN|nr:TetR/AcrR family transcriptional regulator [Nocardioides jishulii]QCX26546.1 TetR family transcriptional regulator [Nocardioides jishulii]TKI63647.1 TetR family transcriptional regulator [Nocardioides jishulii]
MSTRARIVDAAFSLFDEQGFEETTVDDVVERAGVGRTTFFRHFRAKEDAVLPDHSGLLGQVEERLAETDPLDVRVTEAARVVLDHYLAEGERARVRYRLSGNVPAIRSRETAGHRAYQRSFLAAISAELGEGPDAELEAELVANAVITAHNVVLRRWLRGDTETPTAEFARALARATEPLRAGSDATAAPGGAATVDRALVESARRSIATLEELLTSLRRVAG